MKLPKEIELSDAAYKYIPHRDVEAYEACGWTMVSKLADCAHGKYSVLMQAPVNWPYK